MKVMIGNDGKWVDAEEVRVYIVTEDNQKVMLTLSDQLVYTDIFTEQEQLLHSGLQMTSDFISNMEYDNFDSSRALIPEQ